MRGWGRVLLVAGLLCGAALAQGAPYPQRPITIVVTAAAGGVTDVTARRGSPRPGASRWSSKIAAAPPTSSVPKPWPRRTPTAIR